MTSWLRWPPRRRLWVPASAKPLRSQRRKFAAAKVVCGMDRAKTGGKRVLELPTGSFVLHDQVDAVLLASVRHRGRASRAAHVADIRLSGLGVRVQVIAGD